MRTRLGLALIASAVAARPGSGQAPDSAWWSGRSAHSSPAAYRTLTRTSRLLPMRDGVRLAVDVYLPSELVTGRLPTILEQTRYWRSSRLKPGLPDSLDKPRADIQEFVSRGYAYVVVDVRGSGASFGGRRAEFDHPEIADGKDVVDWIIKQPWSNGVVGATGVSYVGTTAELLLANLHPAVKAVAPRFALFDAYADIVRPGGVAQTWFTKTWGDLIRALDGDTPANPNGPFAGVRPVDADRDGSLLAAAIEDHRDNVDVHRLATSLTYRDDAGPNGYTFDELSTHSYIAKLRASRVPMYGYSGWFDGAYPHGAIKRFNTIRNHGDRMVLGPWAHGGRTYWSPNLGKMPSSFPQTLDLLRFFDYHLKGIKTGIEAEPPIHYYTLGEDRWHAATAWPVTGARPLDLFFGPSATLLRTAPAAPGTDRYIVDTTAGSGASARWNTLVAWPLDYPDRNVADEKLLTFNSSPLASDVEVTGHPVVTLWVTSSATDGQFYVYLEDVDSAGRVRYVTEGQLRGIDRRVSAEKPPYVLTVPYHTFTRANAEPLEPGVPATLMFDLQPVSMLFKKGHRIRIAIAGADRDHFAPIPGDPPTLQIHYGGAMRSVISLPTVPRL
ncbi:MAG: CocE/NonD family hydrolase [Gemmatimonadota bacterium]